MKSLKISLNKSSISTKFIYYVFLRCNDDNYYVYGLTKTYDPIFDDIEDIIDIGTEGDEDD